MTSSSVFRKLGRVIYRFLSLAARGVVAPLKGHIPARCLFKSLIAFIFYSFTRLPKTPTEGLESLGGKCHHICGIARIAELSPYGARALKRDRLAGFLF